MNTEPNASRVFLVTAEHASATLPSSLEGILREYLNSCDTHKVFDPGTQSIADELSTKLKCPMVAGKHSRLAIDLNRSIGNSSQFNQLVYDLGESEKLQLLNELYLPFRNETKEIIDKALADSKSVIHLSIHSFTKTFEGQKRNVDLGILFDDQRPLESKFSKDLMKLLKIVFPELSIRANEPYHGREDGHTTALRKRYSEDRYIGIELEFSQDLDLDLDAESYATIIAKALKALVR